MSAFFQSAPYYYGQSNYSERYYNLRLFDPVTEVFNKAASGAAAWLRRMELLELPRYTPLAYSMRAQRAHRRHVLAPLARGRVRCWRSLKDKRRAWGLAA